MPKLKNHGDPTSLYAPEGSAHALLVEHGQTVDVPGDLAKSVDRDDLRAAGITELPTDALLIVLPGGDVRAFPTDRWELVGEKPPKAVTSDSGSAAKES